MRSPTILFFIFIFAVAAYGQSENKREMPADFKTDRCTMFPDGDYAECCVEHDKDYYFGGSLAERRDSDKRLRSCVRSKGKGWKRRLLSNAIYFGVRIGGVHFLPTPFRWGFGNNYPRKEAEKPKTGAPVQNPSK